MDATRKYAEVKDTIREVNAGEVSAGDAKINDLKQTEQAERESEPVRRTGDVRAQHH